jgi:hypothetical protein
MCLNIWIVDHQVVCFILVCSAEFYSYCHECDGPGRVLRKGRQIFNTQICYEMCSHFISICHCVLSANGSGRAVGCWGGNATVYVSISKPAPLKIGRGK